MRNDFRFQPGTAMPLRCGRIASFAALLAALVLLVPWSANAVGSERVVGTVGKHQITEKEVDVKIKPQMTALQNQVYELKKRAIEALADEYLLAQAAKKEHLSVHDYLKRHLDAKSVTEAEAKKYYQDHKQLASHFPDFDKIKDRLIQALDNQREAQQREALLDRLRKEEPVKVMLAAPRMDVKYAGHPQLGPATAPVTIVEFGDFQCPFCKRAQPTLKQVLAKYGNKVRLVYMDFPLSFHKNAMAAAEGARCANEQGKFWPFHDQLFADQSKLDPSDLKQIAKKLGLDTKRFDACLDKDKYRSAIEADVKEGGELGVEGTPAFFINGRPLSGAQPFGQFAQVINEELARSSKTHNGSRQKRASAK
jgi:protein-disulfide isomerase